MKTTLAVSLLFVLGSLSAFAAESGNSDRERDATPSTNGVTARKTASKLTTDGKLDEAVWSLPMTASSTWLPKAEAR